MKNINKQPNSLEEGAVNSNEPNAGSNMSISEMTLKTYTRVFEQTSGKLSNVSVIVALLLIPIWYLLLSMLRDLSDLGNGFGLYNSVIPSNLTENTQNIIYVCLSILVNSILLYILFGIIFVFQKLILEYQLKNGTLLEYLVRKRPTTPILLSLLVIILGLLFSEFITPQILTNNNLWFDAILLVLLFVQATLALNAFIIIRLARSKVRAQMNIFTDGLIRIFNEAMIESETKTKGNKKESEE